MRRGTVSRATKDSAREHARIWMQDPENRKKAEEAYKRYASKPHPTNEARRNAMRKFGREIARMVAKPRVASCKICDDDFVLNYTGRPRIYCEACVRMFKRSTRKCECGRTIPIKKRTLTCRWCGRLWGRKGDGKV